MHAAKAARHDVAALRNELAERFLERPRMETVRSRCRSLRQSQRWERSLRGGQREKSS